MDKSKVTILGIESSCDDTSAAIIQNQTVLSNVIANQSVHSEYGGVVPELASRAHQQNIIPVVETAMKRAGIAMEDIDAVAFTRGPGLLGSLLVGISFVKGFCMARQIPMIDVNHLNGHVFVHLIKEITDNSETKNPDFPFLCLLVSGGHTEIIIVESPFEMRSIGKTIDDAAGEAFDKCAKVMGLPYPGGPVVDKLAQLGNPDLFQFAKPRMPEYNYSFSGLKTSFLYFLRDQLKLNSNFIEEFKNDLCASLQKSIVDILLDKLLKAIKSTGINQVAIAGGVAANSGLRNRILQLSKSEGFEAFIPPIKYTTDNAAMIAIAGYFKYMKGEFSTLDVTALARMAIS